MQTHNHQTTQSLLLQHEQLTRLLRRQQQQQQQQQQPPLALRRTTSGGGTTTDDGDEGDDEDYDVGDGEGEGDGGATTPTAPSLVLVPRFPSLSLNSTPPSSFGGGGGGTRSNSNITTSTSTGGGCASTGTANTMMMMDCIGGGGGGGNSGTGTGVAPNTSPRSMPTSVIVVPKATRVGPNPGGAATVGGHCGNGNTAANANANANVNTNTNTNMNTNPSGATVRSRSNSVGSPPVSPPSLQAFDHQNRHLLHPNTNLSLSVSSGGVPFIPPMLPYHPGSGGRSQGNAGTLGGLHARIAPPTQSAAALPATSSPSCLSQLKMIEATSLDIHEWSVECQENNMSPSASASFMAKASEAIQLLNAITALVPSNLRQGLGDMYLNQIKLPTAYLPPSHHHQPTQPADPPRIPSHTQHYRSTKSENEPLSQEQTNQLMEMLTARRPQTAMPAPPVITNPPSAPHPPAHPQKRRTRSNASRNQPVHPNPHLLTPPTISCDRLVPVPHVKRTEDSPSSGRTLNPTDNTSASRTPSFNADDRVSRSASFNSDGAPSCNASRSTSFCSDGSLSRTGSFLSDTGISPSSSFSMESVSRCPSFASMDSSQPVIRSASFTVGESGKSSDSVKRVMSFSAESVKDIKDTSATSAPLSAPTLRHSTQGPATFNPPPIPAISITHHGDPENILPAIMRTRNTTQRPQSQENDDCEVSAGSGSGTSSDSGEPDKKPRVPSVSANAKMKRHQRALGPYQRIVSIPPPNSMPPVTCEPPDKLHSLVDFCELKGSQQHSKVKQENSGGGVTVSPRQQKLAPIHVSIPSPSQSSSSASPSQSPPTNQQGFTQQQPRQQAMPVLPSIFPHPPTSSPAPITVNTQPAPSQPQPQLQLQLPQPQQLQQQNPPQTQPQAAEGTTPTNISPNTLKRLFSIDSLIS